MELHLADLFEAVAGAVPEHEALVCRGPSGDGDAVRWTYAELDAATNRMARLLADAGVAAGDRVGLHLHNGWPYIVAMMGCFAGRAVPVNVNYRYTVPELAHVFADAGVAAVVVEPDGADPVREALARIGSTATVVVADDGFAGRLAGFAADRLDPAGRSADDLYLLYTGGTTGLPKGVMWRHADIYLASLGGRGTPSAGIPPLGAPEEIAERARRGDPIRRRLPLCPLMHGGAMWVALQTHLNGGTLVLSTDHRFDAGAAVDLIAGERVELIMVIGDATARPIADLLAVRDPAPDLSALKVIASGGAILSTATAEALRAELPGVKVVDTFGASETGGQGRLRRDPTGGPPRLVTDADTVVFDDDDRPVAPGSDTIGRLARGGFIPLGYWGDPEKTAATFPTIDGRRWSIPGDRAKVEADGTIVVLGREAACINTGGEKVFVEEVEDAVKAHPGVADALVVGVPDERFGQRVVAVVATRAGTARPSDPDLEACCRERIAGYKVPRAWVHVEACQRLPTGKPDYAWARDVALAAAGS